MDGHGFCILAQHTWFGKLHYVYIAKYLLYILNSTNTCFIPKPFEQNEEVVRMWVAIGLLTGDHNEHSHCGGKGQRVLAYNEICMKIIRQGN